MKKNRYIPFGYTMRNGEIAIHEREAEAVKRIFSLYLNSVSLKYIAETLEKQGPDYNESKAWNKHMVKRIIEDKRYTGEKGYTALISCYDYIRANRMKADKKRSSPIPVPAIIDILKSKTVCAECDGKYIRRGDRRDGESWQCRNPDCEAKSKLSDQYLLDAALTLLNAAIANPTLLDTTTKTGDTGRSIEVTRLQNEISRGLDKPEINAETVQALIFACAAEKYAACADGPIPLETEFAGMQPMMKLESDFLNRTVDKVLISRGSGVTLKMDNKTILTL